MLLKLTENEYKSIRSTISNIRNKQTIEVWNKIIAHATDGNNQVVIELDEDMALEFLKTLEMYSKSFGAIINDGFSLSAIGKLKTIGKQIGARIKEIFANW